MTVPCTWLAKNIRFLLETESRGRNGFAFPSRARRSGMARGHLLYDPRFIPPCLQITASERLMMISRRLIGILDEKSATLFPRARSTGARQWHGRIFLAGKSRVFWFVHTINTSLAVLRHLCSSERGHPEQLYLEDGPALGGGLCTFGLDSHPQNASSI